MTVRAGLGLLSPFTLLACVGNTGSGLVEFDAAAAGPQGARAGEPYTFTTPLGYTVTLTKARLHVGAVYLNRTKPIATVRESSCISPGTYVAQVTSGLDVDVIDPRPQAFPARGEGIVDHAVTAEVWLTGGNVNTVDDDTVIAEIDGAAVGAAGRFPFSGRVTIGRNRVVPPKDAALPGSNPICQQRIVAPIATDIRTGTDGSLLVRVDPAGWFRGVDFSGLRPVPGGGYVFDDETEGQPNINLFNNGLRANEGVYTFTWAGLSP